MPQIILKINNNSDKIYDNENICCYMVSSAINDDIVRKLSSLGKPVLFFGDESIERAISCGDGIVVDTDPTKPIKSQLRPLQEKIGPKKFMGVSIEPSRHEAMLASETEPDFIIFRVSEDNFSKAQKIIDWYNDLFLIQSAVQTDCFFSEIKNANVDFLIINSQCYDDFSC